MRYLLLLLLVVGMMSGKAQQLSFPEIISMLDLPQYGIDTLMKQKGFHLLQRDVDSASSLLYYTALEHKEDAPAWVRSITVMDARINGLSSRMVNYRTYSVEEYNSLLAYLLSNNYKTTHVFDFKDARHTIYEDGKSSVRAKVITTKLTNGRLLKSYEFELGK